MRRLAIRALGVILALIVLTGLGAYLYLRRSLPQIDGTVVVSGIDQPLEIIRDADNIPHIFASTKRDAFYGLGYVHAQDRLWQMEFQRRIGHGRLSEIFGAAALPQDRFLRTVGFGRAAFSAWDHLPADAKAQIDAYVAGVNAFIATHHGSLLPPEFTLLRFEPAPWTGVDVLVWGKMMAWDLSANFSHELMRRDLNERVGPERMAELLPPYPSDGLSILSSTPTSAMAPVAQGFRPASAGRPEGLRNDRQDYVGKDGSWASAFTRALSSDEPFLRNLLLAGTRAESLGSNSWVVDGTLTASGRPMLANDPHLSTHVPSLWYLAHMSAGDFDVIGATLPGTPVVAIGRNRFIAWGETNVAADVEDFYRERLDASGRSAEFRGAFEPLKIIQETVQVKGASPVTIEVRVSRHGPLVSDAINANNAASEREPKPTPLEPLAFRWTALDEDDNTIAAFLRLNEARNWTDFTGALRDFVVPSQNFVYADTEGHIGYYAPGRVPIRANGDGSIPAEGWTGEMEWTGWIPFDGLPHVYDPPEHFIVTANNRPVSPPYPYLLTLEFPEPYRAQRLHELLRGRDKLTPDDFAKMEADRFSSHARALLPLLLETVRPQTDRDRQAVDLLRLWDFNAGPESAASAIFQAWFLSLAPVLAGDELGPLSIQGYQERFSYITRFVTKTLSDPNSPWCDNVNTPTRETCPDAVTSALDAGLTALTGKLGNDIGRWRWDSVHRAVFPHQGLDSVGFLRPLLGRSVPSAGDWSTLNAAPVDTERPFEQTEVPGYRQIVDLSPANDSRFLDAVGESGHFLSTHYDEFLEDWRNVRHRRMRMDRGDIEQGAIGHLRLSPR
jgi:penicillin amidase